MSDQYLWDKSGAPDAEIERLERTLGSLRYQPSEKSTARILEATREATRAAVTVTAQSTAAPSSARRRFVPALAIAVTFLLAIVAGSLWMKMRAPQSTKTGETQLAATTVVPPDYLPPINASNVHSANPAVNVSVKAAATQNDSPKRAQTFAPAHKKQNSAAFERSSMPVLNRVANSPRSGENNEALIVEGERAKKQLVLALFIASEKLNFAQKKIQDNKDTVPAS